MLQRWRSRSESSERARQASRSAGRVGITRVRVPSCAWPLNNRFQVNTGGETGDERVSRHWACRIRLTGSVFPHTPHLPPTRCTAKKNNLLQSKLEKSALESIIASDFFVLLSLSATCGVASEGENWISSKKEMDGKAEKNWGSGCSSVPFKPNTTTQCCVAPS